MFFERDNPIQIPPRTFPMKKNKDGVWVLDRASTNAFTFVFFDEPGYMSFEECEIYLAERMRDLNGK